MGAWRIAYCIFKHWNYVYYINGGEVDDKREYHDSKTNSQEYRRIIDNWV